MSSLGGLVAAGRESKLAEIPAGDGARLTVTMYGSAGMALWCGEECRVPMGPIQARMLAAALLAAARHVERRK